MSPEGHNLSHGHSQDIVSGCLQEDPVEDTAAKEKLAMEQKKLTQHETDIAALRGKEGEQLFGLLEKAWIDRLDELAAADPTCQALSRIADGMSSKLVVARVVRKRIETLKNQVNRPWTED